MQAKITGPAIEGCENEWEELALMFARAAQESAKSLAHRFDLKAKQAEAATRVASLESALQLAKRNLTMAEADFAAKSKFDAKSKAMIFAYALLGLALIFAVFAEVGGAALPALAGGTAIAAAAYSFGKAKWAAQLAFAAAKAAVGAASAALDALQSEIATLSAELQGIEIKRTVRTVGRVYFPASVHRVAGRSVAFDEAGVAPLRSFKLADFSFDSGELQQVIDQIEALRQPPMLLAPSGAEGVSGGGLHDLHGEESILRDTVERFSMFVGQIPRTEVLVPLFSKSNAVVVELGRADSPSEVLDGAVLAVSGPSRQAAAEKLQHLEATLGASKARGFAPKVALLAAYNEIAQLLEHYRELRTTSIASIHTDYLQAMSRSSWCGVAYHCPKASRNPRWIQDRLGIEIDRAHEYAQDSLVGALLGDLDIKARIAEDPELIPTLNRAWNGIQNIRIDIESQVRVATASTTTIGAAPTGGPSVSSAVRYLESQLEQYIVEYRNTLNRIVFGQRRPLVEFSSASRLQYDPSSEVWTNPVTGAEYSDSSELECSRVLRVHEELLFPMWRHLWTEKADFRRSELFRTNEQVLRMNEKESEKLISIGNQFRDDMRSVREVLKQVYGDLSGKLDQLRGTRDALSSLGLLSEDQATRLNDGKFTEMLGGGDGVIVRAEEKETLLALEPAAQAERRGGAVDPIEAVMSPSALFLESPTEALRRKLSPLDAPVRAEVGRSQRRLALDHSIEPNYSPIAQMEAPTAVATSHRTPEQVPPNPPGRAQVITESRSIADVEDAPPSDSHGGVG